MMQHEDACFLSERFIYFVSVIVGDVYFKHVLYLPSTGTGYSSESVALGLSLLEGGLLIFIFLNVKSLLGSSKKLLALELLEVLNGVLTSS